MNVLIVDDASLYRKMVSSFMKKNDYNPITAANCDEAMSVIKKQDVDLVVLDIQMPDVDGFGVCERIRSNGGDQSNVPVIFITGTHSLEYRQKGFTLGASDFILKQNVPLELVPAVDKILRPSSIFKDINALVVDDSSMIRMLISGLLTDKGINVTTVEDGLQAYNFLLDNIDTIDLIITDEEMPVMQGGELCQKIRNDLGNKEIPIIAISGKTDQVSVMEIFKNGATDYLQKPFVEEEFIARITNLLEISLLRKRFSLAMSNMNKTNSSPSDEGACSEVIDEIVEQLKIENVSDVLFNKIEKLREIIK